MKDIKTFEQFKNKYIDNIKSNTYRFYRYDYILNLKKLKNFTDAEKAKIKNIIDNDFMSKIFCYDYYINFYNNCIKIDYYTD